MIPEAKQIESIKATEKGDYTNTALFSIDGREGVWRQIPRDGRQGIRTTVEGAVVAHIGEIKLVELVRWDTLEKTLEISCGFVVAANGITITNMN